MDRYILRKCALLSVAGACIVPGMIVPASAANLLTNPGFESIVAGSNPPVATGWPANPYDATNGIAYVQPATYNNHTPGGKVIEWLQVFQPAGYISQDVTGISGSTSYTLSGWFYFEPSYPIDVDTYMSLNWSDGSSNEFDIYNETVPLSTWTQYSMTVNAPADATGVEVRFGFTNGDNVGGQQNAFLDDVDLEGLGGGPPAPAWALTSSGDWNSAADWSTGSIPNGIGAEADFLGAITANHTVYSDVPVTAGILKFNNSSSYVIAGAGSLTLQTSSGSAQVIVQQGTQEINLPTTIASNTVFNVSTGASLVIADPITIDSGLSITQTGGGSVTYESTITVGSSASIAFGDSTYAHSLTLNSSSSASISGKNTVLELDVLSLQTGAKLDLGKDQVDINYTGASPAVTIGSEIATAYANGTWTGSGITSSAASYAAGTSVGYYDTGTQVKVGYTWIGDLNLDGVINSIDYGLMGSPGTGWEHGDLNYDGTVNADDYSLFDYGAAIAGTRNVSSVPEPGALGLLVAAGLLARRRRA